MATQPRPPRWTVQAYLDMERGSHIKHEYLDGYVYAMAGGTLRHSRICVNVTTLLTNHLRGNPCRALNSDMRVKIDEQNYVYADATVSCDPRDLSDETAVFLRYPRLIVEVLSEDSTAEYDRGAKFDALYTRLESLEEYMLIDTEQAKIEVRRRQPDGLWLCQTLGATETVVLDSIQARIPVAAFYA